MTTISFDGSPTFGYLYYILVDYLKVVNNWVRYHAFAELILCCVLCTLYIVYTIRTKAAQRNGTRFVNTHTQTHRLNPKLSRLFVSQVAEWKNSLYNRCQVLNLPYHLTLIKHPPKPSHTRTHALAYSN